VLPAQVQRPADAAAGVLQGPADSSSSNALIRRVDNLIIIAAANRSCLQGDGLSQPVEQLLPPTIGRGMQCNESSNLRLGPTTLLTDIDTCLFE
jgi:hypothetical protein